MQMRRQRAQSIMEYAMVIGLVIAALASVNIYLKRGLQANHRNIVDVVGLFSDITQYEPYYQQSNITTENNIQEQKGQGDGGYAIRLFNQETKKSGNTDLLSEYSDTEE